MARQHIFEPKQRKLSPSALSDMSKATHSSRKAISFAGSGSMQTPIGTIQRTRRPGRQSPGGATFPWSKLAFGYALTKTPADEETPASTQCTIYPGSIRLHGGTKYDVTETEVTLAGNPEWIFVEYNRASGGATINHSATEPTSTSAVVRIPLYRFDLESGVYSLGRIYNMGDVNFDLPLR